MTANANQFPAHTDLTIILDRSGSMADILDSTIDGYNRFIQGQCDARHRVFVAHPV